MGCGREARPVERVDSALRALAARDSRHYPKRAAVRAVHRSLITSPGRPPARPLATASRLGFASGYLRYAQRISALRRMRQYAASPRAGPGVPVARKAHDPRHEERHSPRARMPTDLRPDGDDVRTRGLDDRERGEEPHALEQQGLRMHERGLRALRDVFEGVPKRGREEDAVQAPEEVLRDVRGLPPEDMPGARARALRVQRMRKADQMPAPQALLRRRRRADELPRDARRVAQGHPRDRRRALRHERRPASSAGSPSAWSCPPRRRSSTASASAPSTGW